MLVTSTLRTAAGSLARRSGLIAIDGASGERICPCDTVLVNEPKVTTSDLLLTWREAARAAQLAERLAMNATEAAEQADGRATVSAEIAQLAEATAESAERAAARARTAASEAARLAQGLEEDGVPATQETLTAAVAIESDARAAYQHAVDEKIAADPDIGAI